jgi:hypothetical protein
MMNSIKMNRIMTNWVGQSLVVATALTTLGTFQQARATDAPADPCSLLPAATVSSLLGGGFGAPQKSVAMRPYANTVEGTDCHYAAKSGNGKLLFRVYFDHSVAEATDLHARLKMFFSPSTPAPGVADEAYLDRSGAIHARKGNVRFYLDGGSAINAGQLQKLAVAVAARL